MTACSESSGAEAETKWRFTAEVTIEPTASGDETVQHCDAADTLLLRRSRIDAPKRAALRLRGRTRSKHQDGRCGQGFDDLHGVTLHYAATGRNPLAGSDCAGSVCDVPADWNAHAASDSVLSLPSLIGHAEFLGQTERGLAEAAPHRLL